MNTVEQVALRVLRDAGYEVTLRRPTKPTIGNSDLKPGDKFILNRTGTRYMVLDDMCRDRYKDVRYWNEEGKHSTVLDSRSEITKELT